MTSNRAASSLDQGHALLPSVDSKIMLDLARLTSQAHITICRL